MSKWKSAWGVSLFAAVLTTAALLPGCSSHPNPWEKVPGGSTQVLASFPPLYCFAKTVAGPDARVLSLLTTVGPHDHKNDLKEASVVRRADLFLLNGLILDDSLARLVESSGNRTRDLVSKIGEAIPAPPKGEESRRGFLIRNTGEDKHKHKPGEVCPICSSAEYDPHVWLGIDEAILMVERIRDLLQAKDPTHKDGYQARAVAFVAQLRQLQTDGRAALKGKKNPSFITNHHSFRYFARSFGLTILDSIQVQPGVEADGTHMVALVKLCKEHTVRVIGVEPQFRRSSAEALQHALRKDLPELTIVELDPIETAPPDLSADYYLERMKQNLENLVKHLQ